MARLYRGESGAYRGEGKKRIALMTTLMRISAPGLFHRSVCRGWKGQGGRKHEAEGRARGLMGKRSQ